VPTYNTKTASPILLTKPVKEIAECKINPHTIQRLQFPPKGHTKGKFKINI
jgi:hypothetical protein